MYLNFISTIIYFVVVSTVPIPLYVHFVALKYVYSSEEKTACRCFFIYLFSILMTLPVGRLINNELEKAWNEAVVAQFRVLI
jgi:hypothetical protein